MVREKKERRERGEEGGNGIRIWNWILLLCSDKNAANRGRVAQTCFFPSAQLSAAFFFAELKIYHHLSTHPTQYLGYWSSGCSDVSSVSMTVCHKIKALFEIHKSCICVCYIRLLLRIVRNLFFSLCKKNTLSPPVCYAGDELGVSIISVLLEKQLLSES